MNKRRKEAPKGKKANRLRLAFKVLAEQEGFEPSIRHNRIPDFESGAFDHSAIAPVFELSILSQGRRTADAGVGAVPVGLMVM